MIVTCEQCATQFQLDDSKVPMGGVRVRCSRCKHAFFIEPAGAEIPQSPLDRATQEALDEHAPPAPEASEDLAGTDADAGSDFEAANDGADTSDTFDASSSDAGSSDERSSDDSFSDESDWEFNEDRFRGETLGAEEPAEAQDAAREAIDDLLDSRKAPRASGARASGEIASPPAAIPSVADAEDEDLGSPESWDLLAGDALPSLAPASVEPATDAQQVAPRALKPSMAASAARPVVEEWIDPSEPSRLLAWIARSGHAAGWGVTIALFALVAFATLGPGRASEAVPAVGSLPLSQLEAQGVVGRWVENAVAGPLFVVSGRLVNPTSTARPLGALAGVRLLDETGARLAGEAAAIGPVFEARELREAEPSSLRARQLEGGRMLATMTIEPGQSLAFEAVLAAVPAAASRFLLEPIPQGRGAPLAAANGPAPAH